MDRRYKSSQQLLRLLQPWFEVIKRGAYVTLTTRVLSKESCELIATWEGGKEHRKQYDIASMQKGPCRYAREFLQELLDLRGVI